MKMKYCSLMVLSATLFFASCSKDGDDGKTMLTRTTKEAAGSNCTYGGTKFETGIDVNNDGTLEDTEVTTTQIKYVCDGAGAIYSAWIDVNVVANTGGGWLGEGNFTYKQELPATALTADAVNKGIVLMYYKNRGGYIVPVDRDDVNPLRDQDINGDIFEIQGGFIYKQNYLAFLADADTGTDPIASMNANGSAIRYVIIPGNNQARVADLQKLPYSEVAKMYNIQD
ncbi:MAG TPA: hypothetical protein VF008_27145 [Niastella sp.]